MKGTRLVDVLDEKGVDPKYREFWNKMFAKMNTLLVAIESYKGPSMSIDDTEYRWVQDRIEYWNTDERLLNKEDMSIANELWRKYKYGVASLLGMGTYNGHGLGIERRWVASG